LREFCGRKVLIATPPVSDTWQAIGAVLDEVMPVHAHNVNAIDDLYWFYRGDQPILYRTKDIRSEINNRIVENRAFEVVEFKKGYEFSHPVQYTNAGGGDSTPIDILNTYSRLDGKEAKDLALAEWRYICGTSYRLTLPNRRVSEDNAPYVTQSLDPRCAFVVYAPGAEQNIVLSGCYAEETKNGYTNYRVGVYTDTRYIEWVVGSRNSFASTMPVREGRNGIGRNPIVEYSLNEARLGYVEICADILNAINTLNSNRIDAIEQFVQALLVFVNCELPEDEETGEKKVPRTGDAIELKGLQGLPADVKYLIAQLDQQQAQVTKDDLLNALYEICGIPSRQNRNSGGGDTGQAVVLRNGWGAAEARAKSSEVTFVRSEMEYLRIVLDICRANSASASEVDGLTLRDISVTLTRNHSDNMLTKANTLEILLRSGINYEDSIQYSGMFTDPSAVMTKSLERLKDVWETREVAEAAPAAANTEGAAATGEVDKLNGTTEE
jgi:SPP1 family phage portal protein